FRGKRRDDSRRRRLKSALKNSPGGPLPMVAALYVAVNNLVPILSRDHRERFFSIFQHRLKSAPHRLTRTPFVPCTRRKNSDDFAQDQPLRNRPPRPRISASVVGIDAR